MSTPLSQPNDLHDVWQRLGSVMMLVDCVELRTDLRPRRLTVTYHAPCQQQAHVIGKRLIDAQADSHRAGAIDDLAARSR